MFARTLNKDFNPKRLRNLLALFFLALAVPTGVLISQAYSQLKWEAYYQYRGLAEELTHRIDTVVDDRINTAEARSFTDYAFLVVSGDPSANFLQRSPLSDFPVTQDLPGVIGYFQVGANGEFSTPLLPQDGTPPEEVGISSDEYSQRLQLAQEVQQVLADNQLVRARSDAGVRRTVAATPESVSVALDEEVREDTIAKPASRDRQLESQVEYVDLAQLTATLGNEADQLSAMRSVGAVSDEIPDDKDAADQPATEPPKQSIDENEIYTQQVFDQLSRARRPQQSVVLLAGTIDNATAFGESTLAEQRSNLERNVTDLKLDAALQKKSEALERKESDTQSRDLGRAFSPARAKRIEQSALPEKVLPQPPVGAAGKTRLIDLRISTFESEVDPYEFSLLDSGHFVLFRKVWRNGERYIQGLLIDQQRFLNDIVLETFRETTLASMSNLTVAYQDTIIATVSGRVQDYYASRPATLDGTLLYQSNLTTPLGSLQLIYSIHQLPAGPGAGVLGWTTIVIAIVFLGGFYALYRMGLGQINLARQQQDFVSAVSHELKTPLTSIRMYGEMLKEGWADEDKRQQYYGYIHDESERLTRLISNVLQLAKITRNEPQFDMRPRVVGELMSQIESKIANQVDSAGFELEFERASETDTASIRIDDDCFAQIIINLVDNAIKFSKDASRKRIEIRCTKSRDASIIFAVRDFGPGVPNDQMKKIFKLFYRSESELTRETVGTGIGLAIVHQLTTAMNGKVDVINKEPGAEFQLSFPSL